MDTSLVVTCGITLIGWAVMFGICKNKIDTNSKEIEDLKTNYTEQIKTLKADFQYDIDEVKARQNETSTILQSINNNLSRINERFDLLVNGQLNIKGIN